MECLCKRGFYFSFAVEALGASSNLDCGSINHVTFTWKMCRVSSPPRAMFTNTLHMSHVIICVQDLLSQAPLIQCNVHVSCRFTTTLNLKDHTCTNTCSNTDGYKDRCFGFVIVVRQIVVIPGHSMNQRGEVRCFSSKGLCCLSMYLTN